jgi:eukaryotic-like serine/threonine-protein kinase
VETTEDSPFVGGEVGQEAHERAVALIGRTVVGRYRVEELVAQGGLASVFRAARLADGQEVAIKLLHPEAEGLPELIERFEREALAGKHLFHPNVVTVHEIAQLDDGSWFLVQDFVRGETLRALIDRGPVEPRRAARIARHVAAGLNAAHDMGIVHRDIKPRNLMFVGGPDDKVQIVDFGLAKVPVEELAVARWEGRESITQSGVVFGTVAYLAPEAALGMRSIDRRSDLYALGVILYELLAGRHPFTASDPVVMFNLQRTAVPPPIRERTPGVLVPAPLEAVVKRLLEKDPDARYPHARALIVALDAALQGMDANAAPGGRSRRGRIAAFVLALTVLVAALVGIVVLRR